MRRDRVALAALVALAAAAVVWATSPRKPRLRAMYGGKTPPVGRWPYIASIESGTCTGFLVTPLHVVTAMHCTKDKIGAAGSKVYVGGMRSDDRAEAHTVRRVVASGRGQFVSPSDWAVVELDVPSSRRPVRADGLQTTVTSAEMYGGTLWSAGFGQQPGRMNGAVTLMEAPVKVKRTSDGVLQSSTRSPTTGICGGDSGGPMVVRRPSGDVAVGINTGSEAVGKDCKSQQSDWTLVRPAMLALRGSWALPDLQARLAKCALADRDPTTKACPATHPWDSGTENLGARTPAGYADKRCAATGQCATDLFALYAKQGLPAGVPFLSGTPRPSQARPSQAPNPVRGGKAR
jgi:hypothetical protein